MCLTEVLGRNILIWGFIANLVIALIVSVIYAGSIPWGVKFSVLTSTVVVFSSYVFIDLCRGFYIKRLKTDAAIHITQIVTTALFALLVYSSLAH